MGNIYIHTLDIFDNEKVEARKPCFERCHKIALNCGLTCKCITEGSIFKLEMWGPKRGFIKYYAKTISKGDSIWRDIKRWISILFT